MTGPIDLFLVAGQSNAQGRAPDNTLSPSTVSGLAYERTSGGSLVQLDDPVGNANVGSAWPAFANALTDESETPMCISAAAVGGTWLLPEYTSGSASAHWGPGSTLFSTSVTRVQAAATALTSAGWTPTLRGVLWCQGEYDGMSGNADALLQGKYQDAIVDLLARYKAALGAEIKLYVFRTGDHTAYGTGFAAVRAAQDAACAATDDMVMVYTKANTFRARGLMADGFHYTQAGYNEMGTEGGVAVAADLGFGPPPEPPTPVPIARTSRLGRRLLQNY